MDQSDRQVLRRPRAAWHITEPGQEPHQTVAITIAVSYMVFECSRTIPQTAKPGNVLGLAHDKQFTATSALRLSTCASQISVLILSTYDGPFLSDIGLDRAFPPCHSVAPASSAPAGHSCLGHSYELCLPPGGPHLPSHGPYLPP